MGPPVVATTGGQQAYDILLAEDAPRLAIFDWMMLPHLDKIEVYRKAPEEALQSSADNYLNKPLDRKEMQARTR